MSYDFDGQAEKLLEKCMLCPRMCGVNRIAGETGYCGAGPFIEVARTMLHKWEEPCISGADPLRGSGAVFFRHCSLGCIYCQNYEISGTGDRARDIARDRARDRARLSKERASAEKPVSATRSALPEPLSVPRFAGMLLQLQKKGAYNINLVTPTHYMPIIARAVIEAKRQGLSVPVVYNTGGYERAEMIEKLEGIVDVFLTDLKYLTDGTAKKYSNAGNYVDNAFEALEMMFDITGRGLEFGDDGMLKRGVIVRHLVLPGHSYAASKIIKKLYARYGDNIIYSLMNQYTPLPEANPRLSLFPELLKAVDESEYRQAVETLEELAPKYAFIQEGGTISESFIPDWNDTYLTDADDSAFGEAPGGF